MIQLKRMGQLWLLDLSSFHKDWKKAAQSSVKQDNQEWDKLAQIREQTLNFLPILTNQHYTQQGSSEAEEGDD